MRRSFRFLLTTLATLTLFAASTPRAQSGAIRGFPDDALKSQREREEQFRKVPDSARLKEYMTAMAGEPHVAGRPGSKRVAEYALGQFKSWGLDARIETFEALMPWPTERVVEMVAPTRYDAGDRRSRRSPDDPDSTDADSTPTFNAYSADGDVDGRGRLRQLRHAGRLRAPETARRRRQGQDRDRALRRRLARHQAEGRVRARRGRLPDLLRSARRRLLRRATSTLAVRFVRSRACSAAASWTCRSIRAIR